MLKNPLTYEIMTPESVGLKSSLVLGKHSGRNAVGDRLKELGFADLTPEQLKVHQGIYCTLYYTILYYTLYIPLCVHPHPGAAQGALHTAHTPLCAVWACTVDGRAALGLSVRACARRRLYPVQEAFSSFKGTRARPLCPCVPLCAPVRHAPRVSGASICA
jgi:hypothetical protein